MSENCEIKADFSKLDAFIKALGENKFAVRVGIFGNDSARGKTAPAPAGKSGLRKVFKVETAQTNPEVGAIHEFGMASRGIPPRSFLRMPIKLKADKILHDASQGMLKLLVAGQMKLVLKRLGIAAEKVVLEAFESRGFGTWKPNAPSTVRRKGSDSPLIDTGQLRRSIASQVVKA